MTGERSPKGSDEKGRYELLDTIEMLRDMINDLEGRNNVLRNILHKKDEGKLPKVGDPDKKETIKHLDFSIDEYLPEEIKELKNAIAALQKENEELENQLKKEIQDGVKQRQPDDPLKKQQTEVPSEDIKTMLPNNKNVLQDIVQCMESAKKFLEEVLKKSKLPSDSLKEKGDSKTAGLPEEKEEDLKDKVFLIAKGNNILKEQLKEALLDQMKEYADKGEEIDGKKEAADLLPKDKGTDRLTDKAIELPNDREKLEEMIQTLEMENKVVKDMLNNEMKDRIFDLENEQRDLKDLLEKVVYDQMQKSEEAGEEYGTEKDEDFLRKYREGLLDNKPLLEDMIMGMEQENEVLKTLSDGVLLEESAVEISELGESTDDLKDLITGLIRENKKLKGDFIKDITDEINETSSPKEKDKTKKRLEPELTKENLPDDEDVLRSLIEHLGAENKVLDNLLVAEGDGELEKLPEFGLLQGTEELPEEERQVSKNLDDLKESVCDLDTRNKDLNHRLKEVVADKGDRDIQHKEGVPQVVGDRGDRDIQHKEGVPQVIGDKGDRDTQHMEGVPQVVGDKGDGDIKYKEGVPQVVDMEILKESIEIELPKEQSALQKIARDLQKENEILKELIKNNRGKEERILPEDLEDLKDVMCEIKAENTDLKGQLIENIQRRIEEKEDEKKMTEQGPVETEAKRIRDKLPDDRSKLKDMIEGLEIGNKALKDILEEKGVEPLDRDDFDELKHLICELQAANNQLKDKIIHEQIENLGEDREDAEEILKDILRDLEDEYKSLQGELKPKPLTEESKQDVPWKSIPETEGKDYEKGERESLLEAIDDLGNENNRLRDQLDGLKARLGLENLPDDDVLNQTDHDLQSMYVKLMEDCESLKDYINTLHDDNELLKDMVEELQAKLRQQQDDFSHDKFHLMNDFQKEKNALERKIMEGSGQEEMLNDLQDEINQLRGENFQLQDEIDHLKNDLENLEKANNDLEEKFEKEKAEKTAKLLPLLSKDKQKPKISDQEKVIKDRKGKDLTGRSDDIAKAPKEIMVKKPSDSILLGDLPPQESKIEEKIDFTPLVEEGEERELFAEQTDQFGFFVDSSDIPPELEDELRKVKEEIQRLEDVLTEAGKGDDDLNTLYGKINELEKENEFLKSMLSHLEKSLSEEEGRMSPTRDASDFEEQEIVPHKFDEIEKTDKYGDEKKEKVPPKEESIKKSAELVSPEDHKPDVEKDAEAIKMEEDNYESELKKHKDKRDELKDLVDGMFHGGEKEQTIEGYLQEKTNQLQHENSELKKKIDELKKQGAKEKEDQTEISPKSEDIFLPEKLQELEQELEKLRDENRKLKKTFEEFPDKEAIEEVHGEEDDGRDIEKESVNIASARDSGEDDMTKIPEVDGKVGRDETKEKTADDRDEHQQWHEVQDLIDKLENEREKNEELRKLLEELQAEKDDLMNMMNKDAEDGDLLKYLQDKIGHLEDEKKALKRKLEDFQERRPDEEEISETQGEEKEETLDDGQKDKPERVLKEKEEDLQAYIDADESDNKITPEKKAEEVQEKYPDELERSQIEGEEKENEWDARKKEEADSVASIDELLKILDKFEILKEKVGHKFVEEIPELQEEKKDEKQKETIPPKEVREKAQELLDKEKKLKNELKNVEKALKQDENKRKRYDDIAKEVENLEEEIKRIEDQIDLAKEFNEKQNQANKLNDLQKHLQDAQNKIEKLENKSSAIQDEGEQKIASLEFSRNNIKEEIAQDVKGLNEQTEKLADYRKGLNDLDGSISHAENMVRKLKGSEKVVDGEKSAESTDVEDDDVLSKKEKAISELEKVRTEMEMLQRDLDQHELQAHKVEKGLNSLVSKGAEIERNLEEVDDDLNEEYDHCKELTIDAKNNLEKVEEALSALLEAAPPGVKQCQEESTSDEQFKDGILKLKRKLDSTLAEDEKLEMQIDNLKKQLIDIEYEEEEKLGKEPYVTLSMLRQDREKIKEKIASTNRGIDEEQGVLYAIISKDDTSVEIENPELQELLKEKRELNNELDEVKTTLEDIMRPGSEPDADEIDECVDRKIQLQEQLSELDEKVKEHEISSTQNLNDLLEIKEGQTRLLAELGENMKEEMGKASEMASLTSGTDTDGEEMYDELRLMENELRLIEALLKDTSPSFADRVSLRSGSPSERPREEKYRLEQLEHEILELSNKMLQGDQQGDDISPYEDTMCLLLEEKIALEKQLDDDRKKLKYRASNVSLSSVAGMYDVFLKKVKRPFEPHKDELIKRIEDKERKREKVEEKIKALGVSSDTKDSLLQDDEHLSEISPDDVFIQEMITAKDNLEETLSLLQNKIENENKLAVLQDMIRDLDKTKSDKPKIKEGATSKTVSSEEKEKTKETKDGDGKTDVLGKKVDLQSGPTKERATPMTVSSEEKEKPKETKDGDGKTDVLGKKVDLQSGPTKDESTKDDHGKEPKNIKDLQRQIAKLDRQKADVNKFIKKEGRRLDNINKAVQEQQNAVDKLSEKLKEKEEVLQEVDNDINGQITALKKELEEMKRQKKEVVDEIANAKKEKEKKVGNKYKYIQFLFNIFMNYFTLSEILLTNLVVKSQ